MHSTVSVVDTQADREQRTRALVDWGTFLIVVLASAWMFYAPLRDPARIMPFAEDDFYYYLKAAKNVAAGMGSTFDGIHRTNGYHPLYFLVLVLVSKFTSSVVGVFRALWLICIVAATATFVLARKLLDRPGTGPFLSNAFAVIFLIPCVHIFCQAMEVTLTLPLGIGLLLAFRSRPADWTFRHSAAIGLLSALTVFSRLDSVFLVALLLTFTLLSSKQRAGVTSRQVMGFAIGGGPLLLAYFLFNRLYFHTWMPVSGSAKQLKFSPWPTLMGLSSGGLNTTFLLVFAVFAIAVYWGARKKLDPREGPMLAAAVLFPYVQMGALSVVSDWPLWGWYYYTLRFALLAGFVLVIAFAGPAWISRRPLWMKAAALCVALVLFLHVHYKKEPSMEVIYDVALQLQAFERTHPGIYAMGGGAGMPGYLMKNPVIQTEGLMMDPGYLLHLRHQDDLLTTLRGYGVRYYIIYEVLNPTVYDVERDGNCLLAEEPYNVGHVTDRMRSRICWPPVANIVNPDQTITHIYDLTQ